MTFRLNSRCLNILELLVESDQPLAAAVIASRLDISSRMVRTSLAPAEAWLREGQIILKKVPGIGFSLAGSGEAKRKLARRLREYEQPLPRFSSSERINVLLLALFFTDRSLQVKQLQQTLNLSRSTTLRVMDSAGKWLRDFHLELVRRPNVGSMITGDEREWRKAVINLLQESSGDAWLLALFQGLKTVVDIPSRVKSGLEDYVKKIWMRLDIPLIKLLILPFEQDFAGRLSDQAYIKFFIYLAVAVHRNRIGKKITEIPGSSKHPDSLQRQVESAKLAARVQARLGIHLSEAEIAWLALQIPESSPLLPASVDSPAKSEAVSDPSIRKTVDQILVQASLSLHPSLNVDEDLIRNLTLLVQTILDPQQRGQASKNPLLRDVKSQYPYFYSVARQSSLILADQIGRELNEMEVGDLAICLIASMERLRLLDKVTKKVLVVCSAGVVTAWLLVSRLRAEFPDVEVVEAISALELENRKRFEGIDFIVSTIPLKIRDIPSRQVNPLLGVEDIKRLKDLFRIKENLVLETRLLQPVTVHLSDLIVADTIELGVQADTWQVVVDKAGSRLLASNAVDKQFIEAMKQIILEFGPYMVIWPGAVLLHAPPHGVRRLCMGLINLKEPVLFGHSKNDPVKVAVVLGALDNRSHITALLELNQLMQDENARAAIGNTQHKSVILHWVSRYSKSVNM